MRCAISIEIKIGSDNIRSVVSVQCDIDPS